MPGETLFLPVLERDVARVAFGCEPLGGYNWGDVDIDAVEHAIDAALSGPDTILFDTADTYGPHLSELRLGQCLARRRGNAVLATKFGVRLSDGRAWYDTSPDYADRALDASLARLGTDHIDLYQLHWPDQETPLQDTFDALERFREDRRIKAFGVSNVAVRDVQPLLADYPGLISFSEGYSLLDRENEKAVSDLSRAGPVFLAFGCLSQGLLSGKYTADTVFTGQDRRANPKYGNFHGARLVRNLAIVGTLAQEAQVMGIATPTLALAYVLEKLPRSIILAGTKSAPQWAQNLEATAIAITPEIMARLDAASGGMPE